MAATTESDADRMARLLTILIDGGPQTLDAIVERTKWSRRDVNGLLCQLNLAHQVRSVVGRDRGRKATLYAART